MTLYQTPSVSRPHPPLSGDTDQASGILDAPPLDSESAALFRASLCPLISQSASWPGLIDSLRDKGYGLAIRGGRLLLTDHNTGTQVCSFRFLGIPLHDLVARLGRPIVRALPGRDADGEILRSPPKG